jgi:hypothetical protein
MERPSGQKYSSYPMIQNRFDCCKNDLVIDFKVRILPHMLTYGTP